MRAAQRYGGLLATLGPFAFYASGAIGSLVYAHSILGLSFSTPAALSSGHSILILFGFHGRARSRVIGSGILPLAQTVRPPGAIRHSADGPEDNAKYINIAASFIRISVP